MQYRTSFSLIKAKYVTVAFAVLTAVLLTSLSSMAALRCEGVFTSISTEAIESTIQQIAELRINIDKASARGALSLAERVMAVQGREKLTTLYATLDGHISKEEIRVRIVKEISRQQKDQTISDEVLQESRQNQMHAVSQQLPFILGRKFPSLEISPHARLTPLKGSSKVLFKGSTGQPLILDLSTNAVDGFGVHRMRNYSRTDEHTLIALTTDGQVYEMDMQTLAAKKLALIQAKLGFFKLAMQNDLSPDGKVVAAGGGGVIKFYDSRTGKALPNKFVDPVSSQWRKRLKEGFSWNHIRFITDSVLLIFGKEATDSNYLFNFHTGETTTLVSGEKFLNSLQLASDGKTLIFNDRTFVYAVDAKDVMQFETKSRVFFDLGRLDHSHSMGAEDPVTDFELMPDMQTFFITYGISGARYAGIYSAETAQVPVLFTAFEESQLLHASSFVLSEGKLYFVNKPDKMGGHGSLEIWGKQ